MKLDVSRPLRFALIASAVGTMIILLKPDPVDLLISEQARSIAVNEAPSNVLAGRNMRSQKTPWIRPVLSELEMLPPAPASDLLVPPLPPPGAQVVADSTSPPLPPLPNSSSQPDLMYLGRMIKDDKVQVFFASDGGPVVLGMGGVVNGTWRIEAISTADVTLRNLQSGELRPVAMEGNASSGQGSREVVPVQVGQRFLASASIQHQDSKTTKE